MNVEKKKIREFIDLIRIPNINPNDFLILKVPSDGDMDIKFSELEEISYNIPCKIMIIDKDIDVGIVRKEQVEEHNCVVVFCKNSENKLTVIKKK